MVSSVPSGKCQDKVIFLLLFECEVPFCWNILCCSMTVGVIFGESVEGEQGR